MKTIEIVYNDMLLNAFDIIKKHTDKPYLISYNDDMITIIWRDNTGENTFSYDFGGDVFEYSHTDKLGSKLSIPVYDLYSAEDIAEYILDC